MDALNGMNPVPVAAPPEVPIVVPQPAAAGGFTELPPGMIAAVATYLEMSGPPPAGHEAGPSPHLFEPIGGDLDRYRALYARIGEPWLWFSRAVMTDGQLREIIEDSDVEALALVVEGRDCGLIELDFRVAGQCELAFLGLAPDAIGRRLGRVLMGEAIRRAWARPIERLWLHTCTLDHPAAVPFYMKAGLRPYRRAIEIAQDPRLSGHMPARAAPLFPVV